MNQACIKISRPAMNRPLNDATRTRMSRVATIAALALAFIAAFTLIGLSVWGFWICQSFANPSDDQVLGAYESRWVTVRLVLSWLVLFAPPACVGVLLLRSTFKQIFGGQDESWLYPFRTFMVVVGMRVAAEKQAKGKRSQPNAEKLLEGYIEPEK
jgi:O-antigen/teichoic acid export membrane protein